MKRHIEILVILALVALMGCNTFDDSVPTFDRSVYEQDTVTPITNTTIKEIKETYASAISSSSYTLVKKDLIFDAYVVGNDISGNLYQTLVLRKDDSAITIGIYKSGLYTNFPVGTHVTVNLKGMYVGGYGQMAKIGMPYKNSNGNIRMSGITEALAESNIEIIGFNDKVDECQAVEINDIWLKKADKDEWAPMLIYMKDVELRGLVVDGERRLIFAKYDDSNAASGNGVNDTIISGKNKYIMRTSTLCDFASDTIPTGKVDIYGILTRYTSSWQIQLRSLDDVIVK